MIETLSETESRKLSQHLGSLIPKNGPSLDLSAFQNLEKTFRQIIHTVSSAQLSPTHATAAWNCLCALLELGIVSSDARLRELGFSSETWIEVFRIFLWRAPNTKAKSSKQVLLTLTKLLSKQPNADVRQCLKEHAISSVILMICEQEDYSSVRPAFQVLDHFLNKNVVGSFDIVDQLAQREDFEKGSYPADISKEEIEPPSISRIESVGLIEAFTFHILSWLKYPDIASLAGRLLSSFFKAFRSGPTENGDTRRPGYKLPLWARPIKEAIAREPLVLEICETHILPSLLALDSTDTAAFLDTLPVQDLRDGKSRSHTVVDIQLCLSTLNICAESRRRMTYGTTAVGTQECDEYAPQYVAYGLLAHPSSTVRITALSLVTRDFPHTNPVAIQTLVYLQQYIPCFHAEVNPKVRGEFISQISKYCDKLGRGFSALRKTQESSLIQTSMRDIKDRIIATDEVITTDCLLEKLLSFTNWYIGFLVEELQPTATYQRHITALKILEIMIQQAINGSGSKSLFDPASIVDDNFNSDNKQFFRSRFVRLLSDLVMDPFDDVRLVANSILKTVFWNMYPWNMNFRVGLTSPFMDRSIYHLHVLPRRTYNTYILYAVHQAEDMMYLTGRADHADGWGRLYSLLYDSCKNLETQVTWSDSGWLIMDRILSVLENDIKIARKDIRLAVKTAPLHGKLIALRHILGSEGFYDSANSSDPDWKAHQTTNSRILECCTEIWAAVKVVLCFDSPEGYDSEEGEIDDLGIGTKDTLSFCWRALKESSSLMNLMVTSNHYYSSGSNRGFRYEDFQRLGSLAFSQLAELRHRGAFSAVSQTFSTCCKRCAQAEHSVEQEIKGPLISQLPQKWYQDVLEIIEEKSSSLTRRSAGIPAIITGILSAFPSGKFFDDVVFDLQAIADTPLRISEDFENIRLPQVHALNCLKDVFTDALLGPASEPHVAITLEIAASCLESNLWAIRNCGLMLFKALLRRLNSGTDTASTKASSSHRSLSKLAYEKYPNLPGMILRLLCQNQQISIDAPHDKTQAQKQALSLQAQWVFPALEILERSGLPLQHRVEIEAAIKYHMASPVWAIREKAAKALALVVSGKDLSGEIETLLKPSNISQNSLHGRLLCVRLMIPRIGVKSIDECDALLLLILNSFELFVKENECPFTAAVYLNTTNDGLELLIQRRSRRAKSYALRLRALLPHSPRDTSVPSDELSSSRASARLTEAVERSLILINIADSSLPRAPSSLPLKIPGIPRTTNKASPVEQDSETRTGFDGLFDDSDMIALTNPAPKTDSGKPPRTATHFNRPPEGVTACTSKIHDSEFLLTSGNLASELETGWCALQGNPQQNDDQLRAAGNRLALAYKKKPEESKSQGFIAAWICKLSLAGEEHSDVSTRVAAAESITGFIETLQNLEFDDWAAPELLGGYICMYDILFDDDEDVRDQGAVAASTLLSAAASKTKLQNAGSISLMPSAASSKLLQFIVTEYESSKVFWIDAVRRLAGGISLFRLGPVEVPTNLGENSTDLVESSFIAKNRILLRLRPVRDMIQEARRQDTVLFVEEKANLFVDPIRDAKNWADALVELHPSSPDHDLLSEITAWCAEGLSALIEIVETQEDGPLGWTSKPDVFALGMRIILMTRVQLYYLSHQESSICLELLRKLLLVGKERLLHGLWLQQIEKIIGEVSP